MHKLTNGTVKADGTEDIGRAALRVAEKSSRANTGGWGARRTGSTGSTRSTRGTRGTRSAGSARSTRSRTGARATGRRGSACGRRHDGCGEREDGGGEKHLDRLVCLRGLGSEGIG